MDDSLMVHLHGYAAATVEIERGKWGRMDRGERKRWARTQLARHGSVADIASVLVEDDGETVADMEW